MQQQATGNRIREALTALKRYDRDDAVRLIREELKHGPAAGEEWRSVSMLAGQIGEIDLAVEASRRYAATEPRTLDRALHYCTELVKHGRLGECMAELEGLPEKVQDHVAVLHMRATLAMQAGDRKQAEELARRTVKRAPLTGQNWLVLAMIKEFEPGDPDIGAMERHRTGIRNAQPISQANYYYALGKAYHDCGDYERAFATYEKGAEQMRASQPFDPDRREAFTQDVIRDYTAENLARLKPSGESSNRPILVNGLPRSGTTLVEQILTSHSEVSDGAELNMLGAALIPAGNRLLGGARAYEARAKNDPDPWGTLARDYLAMLDQRFGPEGHIVDKTLVQSRFAGLILHAMPEIRMIWLRRDPEDAAISCFRNYFSTPVPWSWSLSDIGRFFRCEDALYEHWAGLFPDRILTVPYEELAADPKPWIQKILAHAGLPEEKAVFQPHKKKRSVLTASVMQVRKPISTAQVGAAKDYDAFMGPFREAYYS